MTKAASSGSIFTSKLILFALCFTLGCSAILTTVTVQWPHLLNDEKDLTDYDAYYVAGELSSAGRAADSYTTEVLKQEQKLHMQRYGAGPDASSFMPWTYPPAFNLFVEIWAKLPLWVSYLSFICLTFGLYLFTLRRISDHYVGAVVLGFPGIVANIVSGQNGFLTAGLVGLFLLAFMQKKARAGIALGLMIAKPHLAAGISLLALLGRRWGAIAIAASIVLVSLGLATLRYGMDIWPAYYCAVTDAKSFMAQGLYPLERMTSVYAFLRSMGASAEISFAGHAVGAVIAVAALIYAWFIKLAPRYLAALTCLLSLFISPYNYDYDLLILTVGMAFVLPDVLARTSHKEQFALFVLCWLTTGSGWVTQAYLAGLFDIFLGIEGLDFSQTLIAPMLVLLGTLTTLILKRKSRALQQ